MQHAVRGLQEDPSCWLQLAIAYRGAGKHVAALKTLLRVIDLEPANWQAKYLIADIQRQIGLFDEALLAFSSLQRELPDELVISVAIAETSLSLALSEARNGLIYRSIDGLVDCLKSCSTLVEKGQTAARIGWKLVGDALGKLASLSLADDSEIRPVAQHIATQLANADIDKSNPSVTVVTAAKIVQMVDSKPIAAVCAALSTLAYSMRMLLYAQADDAAGSAWFDIGQALYRLEKHYPKLEMGRKQDEVRMESVNCVRTALQKEPLNGTFWNLLGVLSVKFSPKLAQHALIRACELNVRVSICLLMVN